MNDFYLTFDNLKRARPFHDVWFKFLYYYILGQIEVCQNEAHVFSQF